MPGDGIVLRCKNKIFSEPSAADVSGLPVGLWASLLSFLVLFSPGLIDHNFFLNHIYWIKDSHIQIQVSGNERRSLTAMVITSTFFTPLSTEKLPP